MRQLLFDNLKNLPGWHTRDKLIVIAVDDYGNVRLDSQYARDNLSAAGLDMSGRFDSFDALETRQDLEALYEVLQSVSDARGRPAVFSPYTLCANPDFDAMQKTKQGYRYESLPRTFDRLASSQPGSYDGAWAMWEEGVRQGLLKPQFHGREHLNIEILERKLRARDKALLANLENFSIAALGDEPSMPGVGFTHAFGIWQRSEVDRHREIIVDGLRLFEETFGDGSSTFTPPAQKIHPDLYPLLDSLGIRGIFKPRWCSRRIDRHDHAKEINLCERKKQYRHLSLVRNVVFEPTDNASRDSVQISVDQIAAAFRWRRPAIISSHRVNFCGHIDEKNRACGLSALKRLLQEVVRRWPDVQFISADQLVRRIESVRYN
jgi:hypothetical protein